MTTTVEDLSRRVIRPTYEFDPDGVYADPQVQAWATYYSQGGQNEAGSIYFTSVPTLKLKDPAEQTGSNLSLMSAPSLKTPDPAEQTGTNLSLSSTLIGASQKDSNEYTILYKFESSLPDELTVKGGEVVNVLHAFNDGWSLIRDERGEVGMVPSQCLALREAAPKIRLQASSSSSPLSSYASPTSSGESKQKPKKSVLGLLEFLNITKKSKHKALKPSISRLSIKSKTSIEPETEQKTSQPQSWTSLSKREEANLQFQLLSYAVTEKPLPKLEGVQSDLAGFSPFSALPPSYEEVDSLIIKSRLFDKSDSNVPSTHGQEQSSDSPPILAYDTVTSETKQTNPDQTSLDVKTQTQTQTQSTPVPESEFASVEDKAFEEDLAISARLSTQVAAPDSPESLFPVENVEFRIVYQNLLTLLVGDVSSTSALLATLREYIASLQSLDLVSNLVHSHNYRVNLLQVVSALNMSEDPRVREALEKDEYEIAGMLHAVSESEASRRAILALEGDEAQKFLDVVQDVIDKGYLLDSEEVSQARRLLVKLSETCDKLPSSLFIKGVEALDEQATYGGGFGDVYQATYNGKRVALKKMRIFQRGPGLPNICRIFCREALVWQHLNSDFIVPFLGIDSEAFPSSFCMVSPWMKHGTVLKHLADHGRAGVDKRLYEIAQGLAYLHSQKIVHGDLRGSNILINDDWQACLTDFGLTVFTDATPASTSSQHSGSVRWMAPELHVPEQFGLDRSRLTPETDIYAFGCVCLELYTGRLPFANLPHDPAVMFKVIHGGRPDRPTGESAMSDQLWRMVEMCWSQHFADRLKTDEVVEFTMALSDPNTNSVDLPVFSEVPKSLLSPEDEEEKDWDDPDTRASLEAAFVETSRARVRSLYLQAELQDHDVDVELTESNESLSGSSSFIKPLARLSRFDLESLIAAGSNNSSNSPRSDVPSLPLLSFGSSLTNIFEPEDQRDMELRRELDERWGIMGELEAAFDVSFSFSDSLNFELS
ncbi:hypothetical protein D9758_004485 [Tetrapyrgos nigripes]|uniref:mitogen-activated protein kinase kinase kinase n=1 Tax=Tetrapyrgos nigripes TaxID=182062 RepID=A0A8H5GN72_9AGAR|nr:hypothetical protein D9758_004485 [Tetrapyrgos nigripes]